MNVRAMCSHRNANDLTERFELFVLGKEGAKPQLGWQADIIFFQFAMPTPN